MESITAPMVNMGDLLRGFMGKSSKEDARMKLRYDWMMVLTIPNDSNKGHITENDALRLYAKCFQGEEVLEMGQSRQKDQLELEKTAFLHAFRQLPCEGDGEVSWKDTLELFRNVIITKLYLHCGLEVSYAGYANNGKTTVLVVSSTIEALMREADRSGFPTEMSRRLTDPESLEPCCPITYTPLSHYYLLIPQIPDKDVLNAFMEVVKAMNGSPTEVKERYKAELDLYNTIYTSVMAKIDKEDGKGSEEDDHSPSNEVWHIYNFGKGRVKKGITAMLIKEYYIRYLQLRAIHGLGIHPRDNIRIINDEYGIDNSTILLQVTGCCCFGGGQQQRQQQTPILVNLWMAIGLRCPLPAYRAYEAGMDPKVWRMHSTKVKGTNEGYYELHCPWEAIQRIKLVDNIIKRQINIDNLINAGIINDIFPLDDRSKLYMDDTPTSPPSIIAACWSIPEHVESVLTRIRLFFIGKGNPSVEAIRDYYGEKVALYFAFLYTLCWWILLPALFGILCFIIQEIYWRPTDPATQPFRIIMDSIYALIISVWATVFLEAWKRREIWYTLRWGQWVEAAAREPYRPSFRGKQRRSPIDYHDDDIYFDTKVRLSRQIISYTVIALIAGIMIILTGLIGKWRSYWISVKPEEGTLANIVTGATTSLQMTVFSYIGTSLARYFNNWENYKTKRSFNNNLIYKTFIFEFINRYNVYFYIAFVKASIEGCIERVELPAGGGSQLITVDAGSTDRNCLHELSSQLQTILLIEIAKNIIELAKPMIIHKVSTLKREYYFRKKNSTTTRSMSDPERQQQQEDYISCCIKMDTITGQATIPLMIQDALDKPTYGSNNDIDGTFDDYSEMVTLFGYMTLFSLAFPLAPLIGVALTALETRVDGFKMFHLLRRPIPTIAPNIGSWYDILQLMSWISAFTNAALLVWTFKIFDDSGGGYSNLFYFVILSISIITFKLIIAILVPDIPQGVKVAQEHNRFIAQRVFISDGDVPRASRRVDEIDYTISNDVTMTYRDPCDFGCSSVTKLTSRYKRLNKVSSSSS